jgi:MFS family permease
LIAHSTLLAMLSLSFAAWMPAMLGRVRHLSSMQIGLSFGSFMLICSPIGLWIAGVLIDRLSRTRKDGVVLVGIAITILTWIAGSLMPLVQPAWMFWSLFALLMLVSGTPFAVGSTLTAMITPSRAMGKIVALQGLVTGVMAAVVAPSVVPAISATLYAGNPRGIAFALSTTVCLYGVLSTAAIFWLWHAVRKWTAAQQD